MFSFVQIHINIIQRSGSWRQTRIDRTNTPKTCESDWCEFYPNSTHIISSISPLKTSTGSGNVKQSISQRQKLSNLWSNESKTLPSKVKGAVCLLHVCCFLQSVTKQCYLIGGFNPSGKNISQIGNLRQVGVKMKKKMKPQPSYLTAVCINRKCHSWTLHLRNHHNLPGPSYHLTKHHCRLLL